jgi:hypothetical protein
MTLWELGGVLQTLHRQGYVAEPGYSFAQRDDQFGKGTITVQAVAIPPAEKRSPGMELLGMVRRIAGRGNRERKGGSDGRGG